MKKKIQITLLVFSLCMLLPLLSKAQNKVISDLELVVENKSLKGSFHYAKDKFLLKKIFIRIYDLNQNHLGSYLCYYRNGVFSSKKGSYMMKQNNVGKNVISFTNPIYPRFLGLPLKYVVFIEDGNGKSNLLEKEIPVLD